jgi:hypothetical protein
MEVSCAVVREPTAEPIAAKAALEGAKIVTSLRESTVWWVSMGFMWVWGERG